MSGAAKKIWGDSNILELHIKEVHFQILGKFRKFSSKLQRKITISLCIRFESVLSDFWVESGQIFVPEQLLGSFFEFSAFWYNADVDFESK